MTDAVGEVVGRILTEERIGLAEAGRMVGEEGRPVHPATVHRWATGGARAADGTRVKLEVIRVGSKLLTSREAVGRFVARLSAAPADAPTPRTPAERKRAADRAGRELDQLLGS